MREVYKNRNVRAILLSSIFNSLGFSILWFSTTWLVYALGGSNTDLGLILGIGSLMSILASILASYLADMFRKDFIILPSIGIMLLGTIFLVTASDLIDVFIGQILVSIGGGGSAPTINALFSDSLNTDERTRVFGTQFLLSEISNSFGGVLGFFFFAGMTADNIDSLDSSLIKQFISISTGSFLIVLLIGLMFLRDRHVLSEQEEKSKKNLIEISVSHSRKVIALSLLSGLLIGFGAGFTIPYLPRFFFDVYKINLSNLSILMAGVSIFTAVWGKFNANLAERFGRIQLIVLNQMISVLLLLLLSTYPPVLLAFSVLVIRNAVMNGVGPIANSILMEYTPRQSRSKVSAINQVSWQVLFSVGNILGGWTVDNLGFRVPILTTAAFYFVSTLLFWQMKGIVDISPHSIKNDMVVFKSK
ncbi:MAG: MFS transporter [Methanobacteriota archaeon]|nr:MAG: MFS transporter [Euryarchaeota archaeon]